jgi:hypothetical protein
MPRCLQRRSQLTELAREVGVQQQNAQGREVGGGAQRMP